MEEVKTSSLKLTKEEENILNGGEGPVLQKVMQSVVKYGEVFGATHLEKITAPGHLIMSAGASMVTAYFDMIDKLVEAGLKTKMPFTIDPRPYDPDMPHYSLSRKKSRIRLLSPRQTIAARRIEKRLFNIIYRRQKEYEKDLRSLGLRDSNAFSCACYLPQVGNTPSKGDILAWAESSAVVFANSVLGARTNRNSGGIDLFCNILGKAPYFGLLTDEGRKAQWIIDCRVTRLPPAQVLGSAIGMKVMEDTPYVTGIDGFLNDLPESSVRDYLKDMGAATASNGAVGLYHVEGVTPEALEMKRSLVVDDPAVFVITDELIEETVGSYPVMWKNPEGAPEQCLIGCPHLSLEQLEGWSRDILQGLKNVGREKMAVETILSAPPPVLWEFKRDRGRLKAMTKAGVQLTEQCPLMFLNNPLSGNRRVITPSNKLRTYTKARYYRDDEILAIITGRGEGYE